MNFNFVLVRLSNRFHVSRGKGNRFLVGHVEGSFSRRAISALMMKSFCSFILYRSSSMDYELRPRRFAELNDLLLCLARRKLHCSASGWYQRWWYSTCESLIVIARNLWEDIAFVVVTSCEILRKIFHSISLRLAKRKVVFFEDFRYMYRSFHPTTSSEFHRSWSYASTEY